ncbi:MAG: carboxymuconolactone decarboxylase family protein [Pseudomonadota bacterium]
MTQFSLHTSQTAPDAAPFLDAAKKNFGMVPNLYAVMAESPQLLDAYQKVSAQFQASSLNAVERNIVWMAVNVEHECHYCVPAHTMIAKGAGVDEPTIAALREARPLPDARNEALRQFTLKVVRERGKVADTDVDAFIAAGFTTRNVLDVVLGVSQKVMSNYVNHLAATPVDAPFKAFDWSPEEKKAQ